MTSAIHELPVDYIVAYLTSSRWNVTNVNQRWRVFEYESVGHGDTLTIILPRDPLASEYARYLDYAVEILSSLTDKPTEDIAYDILHFDCDFMKVRVADDADSHTVALDDAARHIQKLKKFVSYAASSEKVAKPHFLGMRGPAKRMMQHFRFGQTFQGSFGYSIQSRVGDTRHFAKQREDPELPLGDIVLLPLERRVMERIARGLKATEQAASDDNAKSLMDGYSDGFNANMCDAIREMIKGLDKPVEFGITWSKKIRATEGIRRNISVQVHRRHLTHLAYASKYLKEVKPREVKVEGLVVALTSIGNPKSDDVDDRTVVLHAKFGRRTRKIHVILEKDDYIQAHDAHLRWKTVEITGFLQRIGNSWKLSDPRDFTILR